MDRVEYAHSINTGSLDFSSAFINYFDQLMGVYGFIQPCNYQIEIVSSNNNILVLNMKFKDGESALKICSILSASDRVMQIYGRTFKFDVYHVSLDTIQLQITE
jgi:hypothetical protein